MIARLTCLDDSRLPDDQKGLVIELDGSEVSIGRGVDNTQVIQHSSISRKHALIVPDDAGLLIRDLKSTNGVWLNGERTDEALLGNGDTVGFGSLLFRFETVEKIAPEPDEVEPVVPEPEVELETEAESEPDVTPEPVSAPPVEPEAEVEEAALPESQAEEVPFEDDGEEAVDKTMLFGDSRASEAILDARERDEETDDVTEAPSVRGKEPEPSSDQEASQQPEKPRFEITRKHLAVAGVIVLILLVWRIVVAQQAAADERLVRNYTQVVDDFVEQHEFWTKRVRPADIREQVGELNQVIDALDEDILQCSELEPLIPLLIEAHFLRLEREVRELLYKDSPEDALALVDRVRTSAQKYLADATVPDVRHALTQFVSLADLLDSIARYKLFQKRYPDPFQFRETGVPDAMRRDIAAAKELKVRFATLLRENNLPLKVRFRLLRGMADDVDENCVLLVNRWYHLVFGDNPANG
ncbi:FHA domain-containing protein [uncultured Pseudodesulfovibrio sp.]|uniref:FHA domain-containing protein n=1 Tax=uncultured Pseudodesulfovibrio sp. TaxID=2035858 RepID=UPI0029C8657C|nr:FHA domain-containing protein [uncultured Pseudodesulfovibrio sp.]